MYQSIHQSIHPFISASIHPFISDLKTIQRFFVLKLNELFDFSEFVYQMIWNKRELINPRRDAGLTIQSYQISDELLQCIVINPVNCGGEFWRWITNHDSTEEWFIIQRTNERMNERKNERKNEWINEWMNERMNDWMNELIN